MEVEQKGKDPYLALLKAGHLVLGNHYLIADDFSDGFIRRFVIVGFNNPIPDDEVIVGIEEKIIAEEYQQIVLWSIAGAARLLERGRYTIPASTASHKEEWQNKSDPTRCFVHEMLIETDDKKQWSKLSELYELYVPWAESKGHKRMAENTFGARIQKWKARTNEGNFYSLMPRDLQQKMARESRNQATADEELEDMYPSKPLELDADEERATDLSAKQSAERWLGLN